jgi:hypothetical protein
VTVGVWLQRHLTVQEVYVGCLWHVPLPLLWPAVLLKLLADRQLTDATTAPGPTGLIFLGWTAEVAHDAVTQPAAVRLRRSGGSAKIHVWSAGQSTSKPSSNLVVGG